MRRRHYPPCTHAASSGQREYHPAIDAERRSWSHINQVACALRFFYGVTLGHTEAFERIVGGQKPDKLPLVLNAEEVARFLQAVSGLRNRIVLTTAYAAGLIGRRHVKMLMRRMGLEALYRRPRTT